MILIEERTTNKLPGITSLFISFNYNAEIVSNLKTLPNYIYDKNSKEWEIPISSLHDIINKLSSIDDIKLKLKEETKQEDIKYDLMEYKTTPFNYQKEGINYGLNHNNWLLLDAPGLGKSLQLIYLAEELKKRDNIEHCLIICGVNTLKINWLKEINKHSNLSARILGQKINKKGNLTIGSVKDRLEELKNPIDEFFVITNKETIRSKEITKELNDSKVNKFDMIIVDEIHQAKNPNSQQGKNLLKLNKAKYRIGATGTLLLNNPLDAYVPLKWIGAERSNYTNFKYYYCNFGGDFHNILLGFKNTIYLKDMLEKYSLRRTKDLLDLPPKNIIHEYVEMNDDQLNFYRNIENGIVEQVDLVNISTSNLLSMIARLRQATACPSILTSEDIRSSKIDRAVDLVEQIVENGDKVVIFSTFKNTLNELANALSKYNPTINDGDIPDTIISKNIDNFQNDPNSRVFLGTWQKCGTGITLTSASYMIFIDCAWTQADNQQAEDRIYRIGSKNPVFIYYLWCKDTVDERVKEIVEDKEAISDYIVDDKVTQKSIDSLKKYIEDLKMSL